MLINKLLVKIHRSVSNSKRTSHHCDYDTMIAIYMIITVLVATALAKGSIECSFSESTGPQQCFGEVGQPLIFHLSDKINTEITLTKDDKYRILKIDKHGNVMPDKNHINQSDLTYNGTFKLLNTMKIHSGDYILEEYSSNGTLLKKVNVHLEIQGPVSKPAVSQTCLSATEMQVSCSSSDDNVQYFMTLDGHLLIQTRDCSQSLSSWTAEKLSVTINLYGQLTGNVMCRVWNNVSRDETVLHLEGCGDTVVLGSSITLPVVAVAVIAGVVTAFFFLSLFIFCHKTRQIPTSTTRVDDSNNESEVIYTDVKVKNKRQTRSKEHQNAA